MASPEVSPHERARERAEAGARLVLRGVATNAALAAVKLAGGIVGHSNALIADGAESLLDVFSSALVWTGFRVASQPPDADHPYGHGKAESLTVMATAFFLFGTAGWIGWRSIQALRTPHPGPEWFTLPLLAVVIAVKFDLSRRMAAAGSVAGSAALRAEARHHQTDALTSIAALVGVGLAVVGGPAWKAADSWAALFACVVIVYNGIDVFNRGLGDVMDAAVSPEFESEIRRIAGDVPGVAALDKCRVRRSGTSHLVDIQVRVDGSLTVTQGHAIAHAVKDALLASEAHRITDVSVHVEPYR